MDWFSWLSKTSLDPFLVYEYGLAFAHNELEQDDISHFSHDFLQSMGINTAKHRLEILKLAKKDHRFVNNQNSCMPPSPRLLSLAIKKCFSRYILRWRRRDDDVSRSTSGLALVRRCSSLRWKSALLKRNRTGLGTTTTHQFGYDSRVHSFSSPLELVGDDYLFKRDEKLDDENADACEDDDYWSSAGGAEDGGGDNFRWDSMFHNLKPT